MSGPSRPALHEAAQQTVDLGRRELRIGGVPVPIGGRAFEIVEILVRAAGELVTKEDLISRVWPNSTVEENTLQVHISVIRKALGPHRGMLTTVSGRGYRLLGNWTTQGESTPGEPFDQDTATPSAEASPTNLPVAGSELIGRAAATQLLRGLLSAHRVVTLTGPGGIGKTRLALDVARSLAQSFQAGIWLVELAALSDPDLVPSAVASALGLQMGADEMSPAAVAQAVGQKQLLLVIDNCEQVIDAAAGMAEAIVRMCPHTTVLATSREILRIDGERAYRVPPLEVPPQNARDPDDVLQRSAVQLFIARVQALQSDFLPQQDDVEAISAICRRLDGIPLAIEFAAARAAAFGPAEVVARLDRRFELLTGGHRTAARRHQTLRATLDWSYDLLTDAERSILRYLAVFAGGFTLDAACAVLATPERSGQNIIDGVDSLAIKSLVTLDVGIHPTRYALLDTVRAYAHEKLTEGAELHPAMRRHARYFQRLFDQTEAEWRRQPSADLIVTCRREIDNVRTALDWAFSAEGDALAGVMLSASSLPFVFDQSLVVECGRRAVQALSAIRSGLEVNLHREMELLAVMLSTQVYSEGPSTTGPEAWDRVLEIAVRLGDFEYGARALWGLWSDSTYEGSPAAALAFARRFAGLAASGKDEAKIILGRRIIGTALHFQGDQAAARPHLEHVLSNFNRSAHRWQKLGPRIANYRLDHATVARATLARVLWLQGEPEHALGLIDLAMRQAIEDDYLIATLHVLVEAAVPLSLLMGDFGTARGHLRALLEYASRGGFRIWQICGQCFDATLPTAGEDHEVGSRRLAEAIAELRKTGFCAHLTMCLGLLAERQGNAGNVTEAMGTVETALEWCERHDERWFMAELLRIKGELLALSAAGGQDAATHFQQALDWARRQGAMAWELRTATSFARLRQAQGQRVEAHALLAPVYDRMTEGFETADVRAARLLLRTIT